jgi:hypothetical protein
MAAVIQLPIPYGASADEWLHFDLVLGLTADLLPVVSNPNAVISPQSAMKALGKTPSRYNGQRQAAGITDWTRYEATASDIASWSRERDYGISLQTRRVRALDVDVPDAAQAAAIREFIARHFELPTRVRSSASKFLVAFECEGELHKRSFKCEHGIVEWLCGGQQFVAAGAHIEKDGVSRSRYEWDGGLPDAIPALSIAQAEELWAKLVAQFAIETPSESGASVKGHKLADVIANDAVAQFLLSPTASSAPSAMGACTSPVPSRTSTPATRATAPPRTSPPTRAATSTGTSSACTHTASTAATRSFSMPSNTPTPSGQRVLGDR